MGLDKKFCEILIKKFSILSTDLKNKIKVILYQNKKVFVKITFKYYAAHPFHWQKNYCNCHNSTRE